MFKKKKVVKEPENYEKAYDYAVFLLSLRLRTTGEVREKMKDRGYASLIIERAINQLTQQKYLDDERYAQIFLDNLKKYKNFGFYGIKKKMMEKRLPVSIIDRVLEEGLPVEEEMKIAERFLKKNEIASGAKQPKVLERLPRSGKPGLAMTAKQKLAQGLRARGFRSNVIAKLLF